MGSIKIDWKEFWHNTGIFGIMIWADRVYSSEHFDPISSKHFDPIYEWKETWRISLERKGKRRLDSGIIWERRKKRNE